MELPKYCLEYLSESWNQFDKLLGVWLTGMQSREESKDEVSLSPSRRLPNLGDEIHLKGGRIITP